MRCARLSAGAFRLLLALCLLQTLVLPSSAGMADTPMTKVLVDKIIEAYGGREAVQDVRSVYAKGTIKAFVLDDSGSYVRYFERGMMLRVNIMYTRSTEERILNGTRGYESSGRGFSQVTGARYLAMLYQYKQLDLPYGLLKDENKLTYEGEADVNGIRTRVLGLQSPEGPPMKVYVDAERYLIIKVSGIFEMGPTTMVLSAEFSDFRETGGTMMPYRITNYAGGQKIAETTIELCEVNGSIDENLFMPE